MSTYTMPAHGSVYFTCDSSGHPGRRRGCAAATTERPNQGALWLDPTALLPDSWVRRGGGHLCPEHAEVVPPVLLASVTWSTSTESPA